MFTGIIETTGIVKTINWKIESSQFLIESPISRRLHPDESVAHNGVCLTITENNATSHWVTAVSETLNKTTLSGWSVGQQVNLERALRLGDRLDGHLVQGHVDCTATCIEITKSNDNVLVRFEYPDLFASLIIEKGSICLNGISLTTFNVAKDYFSVTIIPYTLAHTSLKSLKVKDKVNLEFDIMGKYLLRQQEVENAKIV